jgi:hypothetical protein
MSRHLRVAVLFCIYAFATLALAIPASACGGASKETDPRILVQNTEIIVRATAVDYGDPIPPDSRIRLIEFRVEEVLKGEDVPNTFLIRGILTNEDDFNDRPVPYDYVRPMGRSGSCSARHYKQGAEFLLFLKRHDPNEEYSREWGDITPYWASMAATNEQLHSTDDAWLHWVKDYLKKLGSEHENVSIFRQRETPDDSFDRNETSLLFVRELEGSRQFFPPV